MPLQEIQRTIFISNNEDIVVKFHFALGLTLQQNQLNSTKDWITEGWCVLQDEERSLLAIICWFLLYELHVAAPISWPSLVQRIQVFLAGINAIYC